MNTVTMVVPRTLVKHHSPHPEPYGESIVVLINDMYTDVYTNDSGELCTITNNEALIDYLKSNQLKDSKVFLKHSSLKIRSIDFDDTKQLQHWMNSPDNWLQERQSYSEEDIRLFISHGITTTSHLFVIEKNNKCVGTMSYEQHEDDLITEFRIYDKQNIQDTDAIELFRLFKEFVQNDLSFKRLISNVIENDDYHVSLLKHLGFTKLPNKNFSTTTSKTTSKKTLVFEYSFR